MDKINGIEQAAGKYITRIWEQNKKDVNNDIQETMRNISDELYGADTNLFGEDDSLWDSNNGEISKENYKNIFTQLSQQYGVDISEEDIETLWLLLNTEEDGKVTDKSTLTKEEYEFLTYKGNITGYSLIHALGTRDDNVNDYVNSNSSEVYKDSVVFTDDTSKNELLERIKDIYGEDSEKYTEVENGSENERIAIEPKTLNETEIKELANSIFNDSTKSLSAYKELLNEDSYKALETAIKALKENKESPNPEEVNQPTQAAASTFDAEKFKDAIKTEINYSPDDSFATPKDVIFSYLEEGIITEEEAKILQYSYYTFKEENAEERITNHQNLGQTREASIEYLIKKGHIIPETTWETPSEKEET